MSRSAPLRHNLYQLLISLDQSVNGIIGVITALLYLLFGIGRGERYWGDETISSHCWRWHIGGIRSWACRLVDRLAALFGDTDHCKTSYESERVGRQLPPELR